MCKIDIIISLLFSIGRTVYDCLLKIAESLEENEDKLNSLDRLAGDGDCGSTLKRAALSKNILMTTVPLQLCFKYSQNVFQNISFIT